MFLFSIYFLLCLGFGNMYGLNNLSPNMRQKDETEAVLKLLSPYFDTVPWVLTIGNVKQMYLLWVFLSCFHMHERYFGVSPLKKTQIYVIFVFFFSFYILMIIFWIHAFDFRQLDEDSKPDTSHAIGWALATFLRHNSMVDKKHSSMERVQSFVAKDKKKILMQRKRVGILTLHQLIQNLYVLLKSRSQK